MRTLLPIAMVLAAVLPCVAQQQNPNKGQRQSTFFAADVVQDIELEVDVADLKRMRDALPKRIFVPATFRWKDIVLKRVGLRYKGNSSSHPRQTHKRSFLVKFSEFVKRQRFLGLRRVALDNGVQFGSLFSERLITEILREVGVSASRANYARVKFNGKYAGVFVNVERVDRAFVKRHFPGKKSALFKVHTGGPGADLRYVGGDEERYARTFDLKFGKKSAGMKDLVALIKGVDGKDAAFDLRKSFDVDGFLWQMGVLLLSGAFDQYTGWGPHNYYLLYVRNGDSGRWHYLTWDLDVGFAAEAFGRVPVLDGWHAAWPVPVPGRPLLEWIVKDKKLLELYRERAKKLLEEHFEPKRLGKRLDELYAQIKEDLARDPFRKGRITVRTDRSYDDVIASMKKFMAARYRTAREQLEKPGARPRPRRLGRGQRRRGGPRPGAVSEDAPSKLVVVRSSAAGVELAWKDNATGERAFIVQRCTGAANRQFRNHVGLPGENLTGATDKSVRAGVTYRYRVYAVKPTPQGAEGTGVSNVVTVRVPGSFPPP